ncbi:hypothetical protein LPJ78_001060 [Coemansia sp. RSA 989]|nr:hypothetical protein BX667DRAFT_517868 [Coemansia mojavensis]KAJ1752235.1 hypothetical protein LPJ79_001423 [Coemansia sp. RSA 1821]KAJ1867378.1 hypothetical protein LPJ78_001060 [Coemansia sp. RSA 989]KAJ1873776.1 hypothetical protein LPJ55_002011 [Coemansia sp. RSA 990]
MGNGMYCDVEPYCCELSDEEKLYAESRKTLEYLKVAHRRLNVLMKRLAHFKRNPLGSAMCKDVEANIYQQTLLIRRCHEELNMMVEQYNHMGEEDNSQTSTRDDWEEVMQMAKMPVDAVAMPAQWPHHSSSPSTASTPHISGATAVGLAVEKQKTFPWQMTPPIEEVVELRHRLRELEQSPLFTDTCPKHKMASVLATGQRSPYSLP